jgi:uncharacterized Zn-finger protein
MTEPSQPRGRIHLPTDGCVLEWSENGLRIQILDYQIRAIHLTWEELVGLMQDAGVLDGNRAPTLERVQRLAETRRPKQEAEVRCPWCGVLFGDQGRPLAFVAHTHVTPEGDVQCPKCGIKVLADDLLES